MYGIIYCIINNINGKRYIGQTKNSLSDRIIGHIKYTKHNNTKLRKAFKKYGLNNFSCYIIDHAVDKNELNNKEIYWIKFYNTCIYGYNIMSGGNFGCVLDPKTEMKRRNKISCSESGKRHWSYKHNLDKNIKQIIKMRNNGESLHKIAEHFSCSRRAIESRLKNSGIDISRSTMFNKRREQGKKQCDRPLINKISKEEILKAVQGGCNTKHKIMDFFNNKISYNAVTNRLRILQKEKKIKMVKIITKTGWTYEIQSGDELILE